MLQTIEINVRCLRIKHKRFTQMRQPNYLRRISHLRIGHYSDIVARSGVRKCFKGREKATLFNEICLRKNISSDNALFHCNLCILLIIINCV